MSFHLILSHSQVLLYHREWDLSRVYSIFFYVSSLIFSASHLIIPPFPEMSRGVEKALAGVLWGSAFGLIHSQSVYDTLHTIGLLCLYIVSSSLYYITHLGQCQVIS